MFDAHFAPEPRIIGEPEACRLLGGVSVKVLRRMVKEGELPDFVRCCGPRGGRWANRIHFNIALRKRFAPLGLNSAV